jgi:macrolide transport system ATP-binding/permease protein
MHMWWTRVRRSDPERELDRELHDHLELEADDRINAGASPDVARGASARMLGPLALIKEDTRESWGGLWIERLRQDLRFAARLTLKAPAFSVVAVLTLATGVGASTTIFSQIDAVFWRPLPVARPHELRALIWSSKKPAFANVNVIAGPRTAIGETYGSVSYPAYLAMRDGTTASFSNLACWTDLGETRPIVMRDVGFGSVQFVSGNYFATLGVTAALGRTLTADDDTPGAAAAVISDAFWRRAFGGDAAVVGRPVDLNDKPFAIVGVMPPSFFGLDPTTVPDVMLPIHAIQIAAATANPLHHAYIWNVCRVVGRLRTGVADEQARTEAEAWLQDTVRATPPRVDYELPRVWLIDAGYGLGTLRDAMSMPLRILMAVVIGILLIACANIAGLFIVRGVARQREIATRLALGASRRRLVRQLLTESLLLSAIGGAIGVAAAYGLGRDAPVFLSRFIPTLYGTNRHVGVVVAPDVRVLLFAVTITVLTGLIFGCVPALRATRIDLMSAIKQPTSSSGRRTRIPADKAMVALQAAVSLILIIGAGLFLRTIGNLRGVPLGFEPGGLLYIKVEPRTGGISSAGRAAYFEQAVERLARTPGVISATASDDPPLVQDATIFGDTSVSVCTPGYVPLDPHASFVKFTEVGPNYFTTMRSPIQMGRDFEWRDRIGPDFRPGDPGVAIVNEAFVRKFFAKRTPLDQRFGFNCPQDPTQIRVIGVVADAKSGPRKNVVPTVYWALGETENVVTLIARTAGPPDRMVGAVRKAMVDFNPAVPTFGETTPIELREERMQQERLLTDLLLAFGAVALALSCIGLYGMLVYIVTRRTPEIGIRMALGARRVDVIWMVLRESIGPVAAGLAAGAVAALIAAHWIDHLLFGVSAYDPVTMVEAVLVFLFIAACAATLPARRAVRINPLHALRSE